jgi:hypothetical protein
MPRILTWIKTVEGSITLYFPKGAGMESAYIFGSTDSEVLLWKVQFVPQDLFCINLIPSNVFTFPYLNAIYGIRTSRVSYIASHNWLCGSDASTPLMWIFNTFCHPQPFPSFFLSSNVILVRSILLPSQVYQNGIYRNWVVWTSTK